MRRRTLDSDDPSNDDLLGLGGDAGELREQDRFLPIANVARIMKRGIPTEQVSKFRRTMSDRTH